VETVRIRGAVLCLLFGVVAALPSTAAPQRPDIRDPRVLRSGIELTSITATVRDAEGRLVTNLTADSFDVYEDGERQTITQFTRDRVPLSLGLLIDVSDSMYGRRITDARAAAYRFLFELLDSNDEFFVLAFNHNPHVLTQWTQAPDQVRRALDAIKPFGGTAAYDAVLAALPLVEHRSRERAALLLVSDGADTASDATIRQVRAALLRSEAFVYAIAIDPPEQQAINRGVNLSALRQITDDSGGRTEVVQSSSDLDAASARIADELNHQYVLGYTSPRPADGQYHSIRVRVRGDYRVRARNGYVATPRKKT
jgi:VWFA-related protein